MLPPMLYDESSHIWLSSYSTTKDRTISHLTLRLRVNKQSNTLNNTNLIRRDFRQYNLNSYLANMFATTRTSFNINLQRSWVGKTRKIVKNETHQVHVRIISVTTQISFCVGCIWNQIRQSYMWWRNKIVSLLFHCSIKIFSSGMQTLIKEVGIIST